MRLRDWNFSDLYHYNPAIEKKAFIPKSGSSTTSSSTRITADTIITG
jgi:hypothetical protein